MINNMFRRYSFKDNRFFYKNLIRLAIPMGLTALLGSLLNVFDTIMISQLSEEAIAAVGSSNKVFFLLMITLFGVYSGFGVFISQYWGKKDLNYLQTIFMIAIVTGILISSIFTIVTLLLPEFILNLLQDDPLVAKLGVSYLRIVAFSYIISALVFSFEMVSRSTEKVMLPLIVSIFGITFNILLNYVLIFGVPGHINAMGIEGAAYGTLIARFIQLMMYLGYIFITRNEVLFVKPKRFIYDVVIIKKVFLKSLPVVGNEFIWALGTIAVYSAYGRLSTYELAAFNLFDVIFGLMSVFMWGVANASAIMLGKSIGENNLDQAKTYSSLFLFNSFLIGCLTGLFILFAIPISNIVFDHLDPKVLTYLKYLLIFVSIYMPIRLMSATFIIGILRSGGDTLFAFIIEFICLWGWAVALAWILVSFTSLPIHFIFIIVSFEEALKAMICYRRYKTGNYIHNLIH